VLYGGLLLGLFLVSEKGSDMILNGLHAVISQKIEFFITTAVRISNPT
jgi:hypothetical protein